jgi:hypothetical protein
MWLLILISIALFTWATVLLSPWSKGDSRLGPPPPAVETAEKAKRTPGRMAGALILAALGVVLLVVGCSSDPGNGQCNAEGQCSSPIPPAQFSP